MSFPEFESRSLQLLEFPKVLERLSALAFSEAGKAACLTLTPCADDELLAGQIALLREFLEVRALDQDLKSGDFPALDGLLALLRQDGAELDQDDLWAIGRVLEVAEQIRKRILQAAGAKHAPEDAPTVLRLTRPHLHDLFFSAAPPERTRAALKRCLNSEGGLKDESSPELLAVRSEIRAIHQRCARKARDFISEQSLEPFVQEDYITISSDRYVVPLKSNFKNRWPGIIHDYSHTGETCYFEPLFLVELNNDLQELRLRERQAEREVVAMIRSLVRRELEGIKAAYAGLVALDVLQAKAALRGYGFNLLSPEPGAPLYLREARHPLLRLDGQKTVPVDIDLRDGRRGLVISGGNAGGKTVCLKTCGLIALMAACALPVPAAEGSTLPLFRKIFVFMGDEQSLEDHVSTFTGQIRYLAASWPSVDAWSMVILDEFGAGTDPSQGAALAQGLIDELLEVGACVLCATHFPALKAYALTREGVRSATVMFDPQSKRPLYTLGYDQAGASQALDVARREGLPESVMRRAEQYMLVDGVDSAELMERLNALAVEKARELKELQSLRRRMEDKNRRLKEAFEKERGRELEDLRNKSKQIYDDWRLGRLSHKQAMREMAAARRSVKLEEAKSAAPAAVVAERPLEIGQAVLYVPWKRPGLIEACDRKKNMYKVSMQGVSLWAAPGDLQVTGADVRASAAIHAPRPEQYALSLDLRGQRAEEALERLAAFLDDAIRNNLTQVEIIHGRGMGALRREVHHFLNTFPIVASYQLAPEDQGGDGKTIVNLKE